MPKIDVSMSDLHRRHEYLQGQLKRFESIRSDRGLSSAEQRVYDTTREELEAVGADMNAAEQEERQAAYSGFTPEATAAMNASLRGADRASKLEAVISAPAPTATTDKRAAGPEIAELRSFLRGEHRAAMTSATGSGASAGYALPNPAVERIIDLVKDIDPFLREARMFELMGQASSIEVPVQTADGAVSWVGETDARNETDSPTFSRQVIEAYECYGNWMATQQFLDSQPYVEDWIVDQVSRTLLQAAGVKFAAGSGEGSILGAFANTEDGYAIVESDDADELTAQGLVNAFYALPAVYHPNAVWVMAPATLAACEGLTRPNTTDTPLVIHDADGTARIMGKRVLLADNAPSVGADEYPVLFGDLSQAYGVAIHRDVNVLRDPYSNKPYVGFYGTLRIGGHPLDNNAAVLVQVSEGVSV